MASKSRVILHDTVLSIPQTLILFMLQRPPSHNMIVGITCC